MRKQPEHHQCRAAVKQTLRVEIDKIPSQVLDSVEAESQPLPEVEVPAVSATIDLADISPTSSVDSVVDLHDYNEDSESETDEPSGSAEDVSDHGELQPLDWLHFRCPDHLSFCSVALIFVFDGCHSTQKWLS